MEADGVLLLLLYVNPEYARPVMSVLCPDLPSYLMFRKEFGSLFHLGRITKGSWGDD